MQEEDKQEVTPAGSPGVAGGSRPVSRNQLDEATLAIMRSIENLEKRLNRTRVSPPAGNDRFAERRGSPGWTRGPNGGRTSDGRVVCYNCGRVGHIARSCMNPPGTRTGAGPRPGSGQRENVPPPGNPRPVRLVRTQPVDTPYEQPSESLSVPQVCEANLVHKELIVNGYKHHNRYRSRGLCSIL